MPTTDPRVTAYIEHAQPFARAILRHVRRLVHATCPDCVETIKWRMPTFQRDARGGILVVVGAFTRHCGIKVWSVETGGVLDKLGSIDDLPPDRVLAGFIREAMARREDATAGPARVARVARATRGAPAAARAKRAKAPVEVPAPLATALRSDRKAAAMFAKLAPSQRREYAAWIADAKAEATRARRTTQALAWIAEGKSRNWKYETGKN